MSSPALPSPQRSSAAPSPTCCTTTPERSADWIEKALAETSSGSRREGPRRGFRLRPDQCHRLPASCKDEDWSSSRQAEPVRSCGQNQPVRAGDRTAHDQIDRPDLAARPASPARTCAPPAARRYARPAARIDERVVVSGTGEVFRLQPGEHVVMGDQRDVAGNREAELADRPHDAERHDQAASRGSRSAALRLLEQAARGAIAVLLGHRDRTDARPAAASARSRQARAARRARDGSAKVSRRSPLISATRGGRAGSAAAPRRGRPPRCRCRDKG